MSFNRFMALVFIGLITFGIVFFVKKPELFKEFWLWVVGLAGFIIKLFQLGKNLLKDNLKVLWAWIKNKKEEIILPNHTNDNKISH